MLFLDRIVDSSGHFPNFKNYKNVLNTYDVLMTFLGPCPKCFLSS